MTIRGAAGGVLSLLSGIEEVVPAWSLSSEAVPAEAEAEVAAVAVDGAIAVVAGTGRGVVAAATAADGDGVVVDAAGDAAGLPRPVLCTTNLCLAAVAARVAPLVPSSVDSLVASLSATAAAAVVAEPKGKDRGEHGVPALVIVVVVGVAADSDSDIAAAVESSPLQGSWDTAVERAWASGRPFSPFWPSLLCGVMGAGCWDVREGL